MIIIKIYIYYRGRMGYHSFLLRAYVCTIVLLHCVDPLFQTKKKYSNSIVCVEESHLAHALKI